MGPGARADSLNQTLVDSHLKRVPGFGTFTTRGLPGRDLQVLGWQAHRSLDAQILRLRALDELAAHLLQRRDFLGGESNADFVDFLHNALVALRGPFRQSGMMILHTGPSPNSPLSGFWKDIVSN